MLPSSLSVSSDGAGVQLLVVLRNPGDSEIQQIQVSSLTEPGIAVSPSQPLRVSALAAHSDTSWVFQVSQSQIEPIDKPLRILIAYRDGSVSRIIAQSIPVKTREPDTLDKFLDAKIQTTLESLDSSLLRQYRSVPHKQAGRPISVSIKGLGPDFICFDAVENTCPNASSTGPKPNVTSTPAQVQRSQISIGAYQTQVENFSVGAKNRVEPGKYLLSFEITLVGNASQSAVRNTVVSQTVDVGVVGESTILRALSIKSFLLLPGSLVMLTLGFLTKYAWSWSKPVKTTPIPEPTDAYFWLASITISGVMALLYYAIFHRSYFVRYGIQDVAVIWTCSVLFGVLLYALTFGWPRFMEYQSTPTAPR